MMWVATSNRCSYPSTVNDVLADVTDEPVINKLVKGLSIGEVTDALTEVLTNALDAAMADSDDMLDCDPIILVRASMIACGFAVSLSLE